jgi:excisionase family DNA binding protein
MPDPYRCPKCGNPIRTVLTSKRQICTFLGISKSTFYRWVNEGLPARKIGGQWVGTKQALEAFLTAPGTAQGPQEAGPAGQD